MYQTSGPYYPGGTYPPPGGTTYPPPGGTYPTGSTYPGTNYPIITQTDYLAFKKFISFRWGEYPKPLPGNLPYTSDQVAAMFAKSPGVRATVESIVRAQGHTHLFLGRQPTSEDYANPGLFAALALWFANGTGDDLSRGEDQIRQLIVTGMEASSTGTGGGIFPDLGGSTLSAGLPVLLAVGLGLFFLTRPTA